MGFTILPVDWEPTRLGVELGPPTWERGKGPAMNHNDLSLRLLIGKLEEAVEGSRRES